MLLNDAIQNRGGAQNTTPKSKTKTPVTLTLKYLPTCFLSQSCLNCWGKQTDAIQVMELLHAGRELSMAILSLGTTLIYL